ncbi:3-oxoacid CoA-transferase subunit B [Cyclobacterium amurskyense]|jgi:3-oxoacid CoA-transferase/3-oxoacid CoA-transferase subunit B|uniref:Succinyl-CoA:3-ketoacid-coenzyme A transferase subunit B n=1 Tax=Cyclobacterium amurskyense TaxID=320787 RepID=A0A0H4Q062_9BACT|nr:3-oxoacid CoA-transferase subunit B [Cyclobacterium amurskyense]AKP54017.1 Succinyl-CoA:3-ketoacid-coenzyme A transferase subunit B [Cyclobacterium amurskyense]|tara:strand:+ start:37727 stop:38395 length:669 start_codon:yes stop_codon:yes gene_type:complete
MLSKKQIAQRIASEIKDGQYIYLGIGIPTLIANYLPEQLQVVFQSENGLLGIGPYPETENMDPDIINASKETISMVKGSSLFDSAEAFAMIRGGHIDLSILGALEVSENGDISNWKISSGLVKGVGGALDLVASEAKLYVAMHHCHKDGSSKLLKHCEMPITGIRCVQKIFTDLGVFTILPEGGFKLCERAPGVSIEEIKAKTEGRLVIKGDIKEMELFDRD